MQSELALERSGYELAIDNQQEGVRYLEVRFAPQLHVHTHMTAIQVLRAVDRGLKRAQSEFNVAQRCGRAKSQSSSTASLCVRCECSISISVNTSRPSSTHIGMRPRKNCFHSPRLNSLELPSKRAMCTVYLLWVLTSLGRKLAIRLRTMRPHLATPTKTS